MFAVPVLFAGPEDDAGCFLFLALGAPFAAAFSPTHTHFKVRWSYLVCLYEAQTCPYNQTVQSYFNLVHSIPPSMSTWITLQAHLHSLGFNPSSLLITRRPPKHPPIQNPPSHSQIQLRPTTAQPAQRIQKHSQSLGETGAWSRMRTQPDHDAFHKQRDATSHEFTHQTSMNVIS